MASGKVESIDEPNWKKHSNLAKKKRTPLSPLWRRCRTRS